MRTPADAGESGRVVERVLRDASRRLLAFLAIRARDLTAAEDALADAIRLALETWPRRGVPDRPEAWLLTVARRMSRLLKPRDSVCRIFGDQFGVILLSEPDSERAAAFAETIRRSLRTPVAVRAAPSTAPAAWLSADRHIEFRP